MCLGGGSSSPVQYTRPDPYENFYNGNIYDPKPQEVIDEAKEVAKAETGGNYLDKNPIYQSDTGLEIKLT